MVPLFISEISLIHPPQAQILTSGMILQYVYCYREKEISVYLVPPSESCPIWLVILDVHNENVREKDKNTVISELQLIASIKHNFKTQETGSALSYQIFLCKTADEPLVIIRDGTVRQGPNFGTGLLWSG